MISARPGSRAHALQSRVVTTQRRARRVTSHRPGCGALVLLALTLAALTAPLWFYVIVAAAGGVR